MLSVHAPRLLARASCTRGTMVGRVCVAGAAALCLVATSAHAQTPIYSNASPSPALPALNPSGATFSGVSAPALRQWSEVTAISIIDGNALGGVACHTDTTGGMRLADDVTLGASTTLHSLRVYAYQPGASGAASPIAGATLRIWNGVPGAPGSAVVFGDATTNRLMTSASTGVLRVFTTEVGPLITPPDASRMIFSADIAINTALPAGTYWLDWQLTPSQSGAMLFSPTATLATARSLLAWNARQQSAGVWAPLSDAGKPVTTADVPQDLPFILFGGAACDSLDFNQDGDFPTPLDLEDFVNAVAGNPCATCSSDLDFNNDGDFPTPLDIEAFISVSAGGPCL